MTRLKASQRTYPRCCWRVIAGGVLGLWIGLAIADEAGPEFRHWTIPFDSGSADPKPAPTRAMDGSEGAENPASDRTGVRSRLSRSAGSGMNGSSNNAGGSGRGGGGGGGGGGGR